MSILAGFRTARAPGRSEVRLDIAENHLLRRLAEEDRLALQPILRPVGLARGTVLQEAGHPVASLVFPTTCLVSLLHVLRNGAAVEAACVGPEGVSGLAGLTAPGTAESRALVQVQGQAWIAEVEEVRRLLPCHPALAALLQGFEAELLHQLVQRVGCNQFHSAGQRMARWLSTSFRRTGSDELSITHEALAELLAIRRPTVTALAGVFRARGALEFRRGRVRLCDAPLLEAMACECARGGQPRG